MWQALPGVLREIYRVLTKNEAVYLFHLVPIAYFVSIVVRLVFYKLKYREQIYFRDIISVATTLLIFIDYLNYLRLLITGTGKLIPFPALLIKYTIGFLLWVWMFWYSYQVHLKKSLQGKHLQLKKRHVVIFFIGAMVVILVIIGTVLSS
jgi:hypothetical protein